MPFGTLLGGKNLWDMMKMGNGVKGLISVSNRIFMKKQSETIKVELFTNLTESRAAILEEASQLSPTAQDTIFLGVWSLKI